MSTPTLGEGDGPLYTRTGPLDLDEGRTVENMRRTHLDPTRTPSSTCRTTWTATS